MILTCSLFDLDVPKWLKHLRLHKYDAIFSQITYDQMMNLTVEQLKELQITDGACAKILLNIKKLKKRSSILRQAMSDYEQNRSY
jgi:SAM domain (Sterile alpha motif)